MLNQPLNPVFDRLSDDIVDPGSISRFRFLFTVFCLVAAVIVARIAWVQSQLAEDYLDVLNVTTTDYEIIPARDGRILADSAVLAADEDLYSVEVHYRWLEEPVSEDWVSRHVRSVLTREERRDSELSARVRASRLQQRADLWRQLSQISAVSDGSLNETRRRIQNRVQRIAADVERRRREQRERQSGLRDPERIEDVSFDRPDGFLMMLARRVREAVTTTPRRVTDDRIVIREEEDFHVVLEDVPLEIAAEIRAHPERFPGTRISVATRRTYPQRSLASHVVGARTELREDEQRQLDSETQRALSSWIPRRGRSGVEYSWDHRLQGTAGLRKTVRNRRQQIIESAVVRNPAAGHDVLLTLNLRLQQHAERLLAEALTDAPRSSLPEREGRDVEPEPVPGGGCVLVMDVRTGRLLAAASAPAFDLSLFSSGTTDEWAAVNADRRQPFLSRVTSMVLPPGSTFKPLTAVAALQSEIIGPDTPIYCQGYLDNPDEHRCLIFRQHGAGHEDVSLRRALAQSCNVYFFRIAREMGIEPLCDWCGRFGFGVPTGVDLPFEKAGSLPRPPPQEAADSVRRRHEREALGLAIGQSRLTTTPLQIVRMMAAIANGGWLVVPHIVSIDGIARTADELDDSARDLSRRRISGLRTETLNVIREGLTEAVEQPWGTGYRTVRLKGVSIAGKSGTAETAPGQPDHAWFTGYVPADHPRYAFVVVLEHGGSGSRAAGPVVRELIRLMLAEQLIGG